VWSAILTPPAVSSLTPSVDCSQLRVGYPVLAASLLMFEILSPSRRVCDRDVCVTYVCVRPPLVLVTMYACVLACEVCALWAV
jgi:hypothetical protein